MSFALRGECGTSPQGRLAEPVIARVGAPATSAGPAPDAPRPAPAPDTVRQKSWPGVRADLLAAAQVITVNRIERWDQGVARQEIAGDAHAVRADDAAVRRRREQNLLAARPDTRSIAPSIRNFAQAIDRQRQAVERVPLLAASRPGLIEVVRALDGAEVAALAIAVEDPLGEVSALAQAAQATTVPLLRCDLLLEEFQVYESRAAGADAVLLHARLLPGEHLDRLCGAARATHMAACVACETPEEVQRAAAARAAAVAFARPDETLFAAVPRRLMVLALEPDAAVRGRADALLDLAIGSAPDPAAAFRSALQQE